MKLLRSRHSLERFFSVQPMIHVLPWGRLVSCRKDMKFGEGRLPRQVRNAKSDFGPGISRLTWGLMVSLLVGCASGPPRFDQALLADQGAAVRNQGVIQAYHVFCPDVLEIRIAGRPDLSGWRAIDAEGRIDLGRFGRLRVEGRTVPQVVRLL